LTGAGNISQIVSDEALLKRYKKEISNLKKQLDEVGFPANVFSLSSKADTSFLSGSVNL
jgi:hypothetical protein